MLIADLKKQMFQAMKAKQDVKKEILRVAIGEIETEAMRAGSEPSDELAHKVLKKLVKSDEESLAHTSDPDQKRVLEEELGVLRSHLPQAMSAEQIVEALAPVAEQVRAAKSDGQATGVAMKHLKASGAPVEGKDVAAAVKALRS